VETKIKILGNFSYICKMEHIDKIQELEGDIYDLKSELKECRDRELLYKGMLSEINDSIMELFKREQENERFRFDEKIDYREYVINLKKDLDEYKRIYRNIHF
jgi:hypothetical protein